MKWSLFLFYCTYCLTHDIPGKTYEEFFKDRELVADMLKAYYSNQLTL